jgi:EAL domain-containing protein (putative c-di-GMP-specific phosphodiesterase class I)
MLAADRPESVFRGTRLLQEMLRDQACDILYQPIVELDTRKVVAYEALCRGRHPQLSRDPTELLRLAEQCGVVIELCQMLARLAVSGSGGLPAGAKLFVNLHAQEVAAPGLAESLVALKALVPGDRPIVLELPESSVTDLKTMKANRDIFGRLGFEFAYDDFGAGQGHLMELTETPPHYLKIDKSMISGIEFAKSRQDMVAALLGVARGLGMRVIAEGIETEAVARICQDLGCDLGQGYLFGRPA